MIMNGNNFDANKIGGKAKALALLDFEVQNIPQWFVIPYDDFNKEGIETDIKHEISKLGNGKFAVRSSALDEDGCINSFAGQLDTFLNVEVDDVYENVQKVWQSAFSERVKAYKQERDISSDNAPAVIVQRMVNAEFAGVAFSANPINGNVKECVINAVRGLGDKLVDGTVNSDSYIVINGTVKQKELTDDTPLLTDKQIYEIAELCQKVSRFFGRYQDIEWAYENGKLFLLQSRPITSLRYISSHNGYLNLWDNSNIAESYNGVTTPLTFSFIRLAYEHVYRQMCIMLGVSSKKLASFDGIFAHMLGLHDGQVYYNMLSWYKLLAILPGYKTNSRFMEQMMGVREELSPEIRDLMPKNLDSKLSDMKNLVGSLFGLIRQYCRNEKSVAGFYKLLDDTLVHEDFYKMSIYELCQYYREIEGRLLTKWNAPVINDFFSMIFYGLLKSKTKDWCGIDDENKFNGLLRNTGDIISAEPARRVSDMAKMIVDDDEFINCLINDNVTAIKRRLKSHKIAGKMQEYLDKFGDRCINELKLESETLCDNPLGLFRAVGNYALKLKNKDKINITLDDVNTDKAILKGLGLKKGIFKFILKNARRTIKNRENLRFERTRLFGVVRSLFKEIGVKLASFNVIDDAQDIFYLELDEIIGYIEGIATTKNLRGLVELRRKEFSGYKKLENERFRTFDCVNLSNKHAKKTQPIVGGNTLKGLGCCPGIVRGTARVITDPSDAFIKPGDILVAQRTDPGWIMLFPVAAGVLVEFGSLLSHAAIVVREMGIPAVVSIPNLFSIIKDGDLIEFNGETGEITIIEGNEI